MRYGEKFGGEHNNNDTGSDEWNSRFHCNLSRMKIKYIVITNFSYAVKHCLHFNRMLRFVELKLRFIQSLVLAITISLSVSLHRMRAWQDVLHVDVIRLL